MILFPIEDVGCEEITTAKESLASWDMENRLSIECVDKNPIQEDQSAATALVTLIPPSSSSSSTSISHPPLQFAKIHQYPIEESKKSLLTDNLHSSMHKLVSDEACFSMNSNSSSLLAPASSISFSLHSKSSKNNQSPVEKDFLRKVCQRHRKIIREKIKGMQKGPVKSGNDQHDDFSVW